MDCIVHGVAKSQTRLSDFHFIITPSRHYHNEKPSFPLVSSLFSSLYYQYVSLNSCQSRILCSVQTVPPRIGSSPASVQTEHQQSLACLERPYYFCLQATFPGLVLPTLWAPREEGRSHFQLQSIIAGCLCLLQSLSVFGEVLPVLKARPTSLPSAVWASGLPTLLICHCWPQVSLPLLLKKQDILLLTCFQRIR